MTRQQHKAKRLKRRARLGRKLWPLAGFGLKQFFRGIEGMLNSVSSAK
jgi:hypothetical protein